MASRGAKTTVFRIQVHLFGRISWPHPTLTKSMLFYIVNSLFCSGTGTAKELRLTAVFADFVFSTSKLLLNLFLFLTLSLYYSLEVIGFTQINRGVLVSNWTAFSCLPVAFDLRQPAEIGKIGIISFQRWSSLWTYLCFREVWRCVDCWSCRLGEFLFEAKFVWSSDSLDYSILALFRRERYISSLWLQYYGPSIVFFQLFDSPSSLDYSRFDLFFDHFRPPFLLYQSHFPFLFGQHILSLLLPPYQFLLQSEISHELITLPVDFFNNLLIFLNQKGIYFLLLLLGCFERR